MSTPLYTPWRVDFVAGLAPIIFDARGVIVAIGVDTHPERAHLVSMAPDMIAVLGALVEAVSAVPQGWDRPDVAHSLSTALAEAIALLHNAADVGVPCILSSAKEARPC